MLPELRRGSGLTTWKVKDKDKWVGSWEEVKEEKGTKLFPSMFPADDLQALNIPYCMRFLPHHQDTGGFFVCLMEKVSAGLDLCPSPYRRYHLPPYSFLNAPAALLRLSSFGHLGYIK
jgi:hypothetical protein